MIKETFFGSFSLKLCITRSSSRPKTFQIVHLTNCQKNEWKRAQKKQDADTVIIEIMNLFIQIILIQFPKDNNR